MPQRLATDLPFIDSFQRVATGLAEAEPEEFRFEGIGILDPWSDDRTRHRERAERAAGEGEFDELDPLENFDAQAWAAQYENGRIPTSALQQVMPGHYLRPDVAQAFNAMVQAARADGVRITLTGSYRDYATQVSTAQSKGLYRQGGLAAVPGTSLHGLGIAVDVGEGEQREWLAAHGAEYGFETIPREPWHWQWASGEVSSDVAARASTAEQAASRRRGPPSRDTTTPAFSLVNAGLADPPAFGAVMAAAMQSPTIQAPRSNPARERGGSVKAQLQQGFLDAGRPDLAKMVYTKDFEAWISAESGWRADAVSQSFPGHGRNYGLFQFWEGHPWTDAFLDGETTWTADAYTQAKLVTRYFPHLTPDDIRRYAQQIRAGQYEGWG